MIPSKEKAYAGLLARAWVDPEFRKKFLENPWEFLANQGLHDAENKPVHAMPRLTTKDQSMFEGIPSCNLTNNKRSLLADVMSPVP